MSQIENLEKMVGWGIGRTCVKCKHVQTGKQLSPGKCLGRPIASISGRLGWYCQNCNYPHQEP